MNQNKAIAIAMALLMTAVFGTMIVSDAQASLPSGWSGSTIYQNTEHVLCPLGASTAMDSNGKMHVIYPLIDNATSSFSSYLTYTDNTAGSWSTPVMINGSMFHYAPGYRTMAVDSSGHTHVVFYSMGLMYPFNSGIYYATNAGGSWVTKLIASTSGDNGAPVIAIDSSQTVHIAYSTGSDLIFGTFSGGEFINSSIAQTSNYEPNPMVASNMYGVSLAIDPSNNFLVTYVRQIFSHSGEFAPKGELHLLSNAGGSWKDSTIGTSHEVVTDVMTMDHNGKAHIAYSTFNDTSNTSSISYASNSGGSWTITNVISMPGYYAAVYGAQIVVDTANSPIIAYSNITFDSSKTPNATGEIDIATLSSGKWDPARYNITDALLPNLQIGPENQLNLVYTSYNFSKSTPSEWDFSLAYAVSPGYSTGSSSFFGLSDSTLLIAGIVGIVAAVAIVSAALMMRRKSGPEGSEVQETIVESIQPVVQHASSSCTNCGTKIPPGFNACPNCGVELK